MQEEVRISDQIYVEMNNPGAGDCAFYSFSIALFFLIQKEFSISETSPLFEKLISDDDYLIENQEAIKQDILAFAYKGKNDPRLLETIMPALRRRLVNIKIQDLELQGDWHPVFFTEFNSLVTHYYIGTKIMDATYNGIYNDPDVKGLAKHSAQELKKMAPITSHLAQEIGRVSKEIFHSYKEQKTTIKNWFYSAFKKHRATTLPSSKIEALNNLIEKTFNALEEEPNDPANEIQTTLLGELSYLILQKPSRGIKNFFTSETFLGEEEIHQVISKQISQLINEKTIPIVIKLINQHTDNLVDNNIRTYFLNDLGSESSIIKKAILDSAPIGVWADGSELNYLAKYFGVDFHTSSDRATSENNVLNMNKPLVYLKNIRNQHWTTLVPVGLCDEGTLEVPKKFFHFLVHPNQLTKEEIEGVISIYLKLFSAKTYRKPAEYICKLATHDQAIEVEEIVEEIKRQKEVLEAAEWLNPDSTFTKAIMYLIARFEYTQLQAPMHDNAFENELDEQQLSLLA